MTSPVPVGSPSETAQNTNVSVPLTIPTGTAAGDLLVIEGGYVQGSTAAMRAPTITGGAGTTWYTFMQQVGTSAGNLAVFGYCRWATAADVPGSTINFKQNAAVTVGTATKLSTWRGSSGFPQFLQTNFTSVSGSNPETLTPTPNPLPEPNGTVVVGAFATATSSTITALTTSATQTASFTDGAQTHGLVEGYNTQATEGAATTQALSITTAAAATLEYASWAYELLGVQPTSTVGYRTGDINGANSSTSQTVVIPGDAQVGDLMVVFLPANPSGLAPPTGGSGNSWTQLSSAAGTTWVRAVAAGDPGATLTVTYTSAASYFLTVDVFYNWGTYQTTSISSFLKATNTSTTTSLSAPISSTSANGSAVLSLWGAINTSAAEYWTTSPNYPAQVRGVVANGLTNQWIGGSAYQSKATAGFIGGESIVLRNAPTGSQVMQLLVIPPISPPLAPTLLSPANSMYMDVSGTPSFSWADNPTLNDGAQSGIEFRRKVSGAGSYSYWNPTTSTWQSTPLTFTWATQTYTFPTGSWSNSTIYNWNIATQEGTNGGLSPFASSDFTLIAQAPPVATITAPTGTIQTTGPTVTASAAVAPGAALTAWRVVIYTAAQVMAGGFNPGVTVGVWDSETVAAAGATSVTQPVPANTLSNNVTYYAYVLITETGGETGSWSSGVFAVSFDAPATPTLTAAPSTSGQPRISLTVAAFDNLLSTVDASVEGSVGTHVADANCAVALTTGWALDGSDSLRLTASAAGDMSEKTSGGYPVQPNTAYSAVASFHAETTARAVKVGIIWKTAAGAEISRSYGATVNDATGAPVQASVVGATSPANAAEAEVVTYVVGAANGENHDVDEWAIFPGSKTTWTRGGLVGQTSATIQRSLDGGVTWTTIRETIPAVAVPAGQVTAAAVDYEVGFGQAVKYRAQISASPAGVVLSSAWSATVASVMPFAPNAWWWTDPTNPAVSFQVQELPGMASGGGITVPPILTMEEDEQMSIDYPLSSSSSNDPVLPVVQRGALNSGSFTAMFVITNAADWATWKLLRRKTGMLRTDEGELYYVVVGPKVPVPHLLQSRVAGLNGVWRPRAVTAPVTLVGAP